MFEISRQATKPLPGRFISITIGLSLGLSLGLPNCALSQDEQPIPTVQDHDIEIVESPFSQPQAFSPSFPSFPSFMAWPCSPGQTSLGRYPGLGMIKSSLPFGSIPYVGGIPYVGMPHVPSISIPYVRGFGGFGGYGTGVSSGFGSSYSSAYSWARPFGRLSSQSFIQAGPSKAAGNYYAPATADPTAAGGYYAESQPTPKPRNQVFDENYNDYGNYSTNSYRRSKAASYGNSDHTKPQKNYWGGSGSPFPQDLNSTPWSK